MHINRFKVLLILTTIAVSAAAVLASPYLLNRRLAFRGGVTPAWHDSIDPLTATASESNYTANTIAVKITLPSGGSATKIRVWYQFTGASTPTLRGALYDGSKNLLQSGSVVMPSFGADDWAEITITPQAVSAGTYYIAWSPSADGGITTESVTGSSGDGLVNYTDGYSAMPLANVTTNFGNTTVVSAAGIYVE